MPKITFKGAKKKADEAMSLYIRQRDHLTCVCCGRKENLNNGHYVSRIFMATRYDEENCYCQCANCNRRHEYDPEPLRKYIVDHRGSEFPETLSNRARKTKKYKIQELLDLAEYFNEECEKLKNFNKI